MEPRYTITQFNEQYTSDDACLDEIFQNRYGGLKACPSCNRNTKFYRLKNRRCYSCKFCGHHLYPLSGTIFDKTRTPLKSWFYAIFLFSKSKNGVSAMELQRQLGVTYKCAWRMGKQIRQLFSQKEVKMLLSNTVEVDETYIGRKAKWGEYGRSMAKKAPVVGVVERQGEVRAFVTPDTKWRTVIPIIEEHVKDGTRVITDDYLVYNMVSDVKYKHDVINHSQYKYVLGDIHTNSIEGFWSQLKRSIKGTYHFVSKKYLQSYVDESVYRYNHRSSSSPLFSLMTSEASKQL